MADLKELKADLLLYSYADIVMDGYEYIIWKKPHKRWEVIKRINRMYGPGAWIWTREWESLDCMLSDDSVLGCKWEDVDSSCISF